MTSEYWRRIAALAEESRDDCEAFEPPDEFPATDRAMTYLREGVGEVLSVYVDARTGESVEFDAVELALLQQAMNDWLELYARCYRTEIDAEFTVREAAELLVETHNLTDTAQLLTGVPERDRQQGWDRRKVK